MKKFKISLCIIILVIVAVFVALMFCPKRFDCLIENSTEIAAVNISMIDVENGEISSNIIEIDKNEVLLILKDYLYVRSFMDSELSAALVNIYTSEGLIYVDENSNLHIDNIKYKAINYKEKSLFHRIKAIA